MPIPDAAPRSSDARPSPGAANRTDAPAWPGSAAAPPGSSSAPRPRPGAGPSYAGPARSREVMHSQLQFDCISLGIDTTDASGRVLPYGVLLGKLRVIGGDAPEEPNVSAPTPAAPVIRYIACCAPPPARLPPRLHPCGSSPFHSCFILRLVLFSVQRGLGLGGTDLSPRRPFHDLRTVSERVRPLGVHDTNRRRENSSSRCRPLAARRVPQRVASVQAPVFKPRAAHSCHLPHRASRAATCAWHAL